MSKLTNKSWDQTPLFEVQFVGIPPHARWNKYALYRFQQKVGPRLYSTSTTQQLQISLKTLGIYTRLVVQEKKGQKHRVINH